MIDRLLAHRKALEEAIRLGQGMQQDLELAVARAKSAEQQLALKREANDGLREERNTAQRQFLGELKISEGLRTERDDLRARLERLCEAVTTLKPFLPFMLGHGATHGQLDSLYAALVAARAEGKAEQPPPLTAEELQAEADYAKARDAELSAMGLQAKPPASKPCEEESEL